MKWKCTGRWLWSVPAGCSYPDAETQGYVAIDRVDSRIVVAFRGMCQISSIMGDGEN